MKRRNKKFLALLCAMVMLVCTLSMSTYAAEATAVTDEVETMAYKLPSVTGYAAASRFDGVYLKWNRVSGAEGYLIYGIRPGRPYGYLGMTSNNYWVDKQASTTAYTFYWVFPYNHQAGQMVAGYCSTSYKYGTKYYFETDSKYSSYGWGWKTDEIYYDANNRLVLRGRWYNNYSSSRTVRLADLAIRADSSSGRVIASKSESAYITIPAYGTTSRTYYFTGSQIKSLIKPTSDSVNVSYRYYY